MKRAKLMQALAAKELKGKAEAAKSTDISHFAIFQQAGSNQTTKPQSKTGGYLTKDAFAAKPGLSNLADPSEPYDYDVQSENSNLEDWQLHALKPKLKNDSQTVRPYPARRNASESVDTSEAKDVRGVKDCGAKADVVWKETERIRKRCEELNEAVDNEEIETLLEQTEARVCEGKSEEFVRAFKAEWIKQKGRIATSQVSLFITARICTYTSQPGFTEFR